MDAPTVTFEEQRTQVRALFETYKSAAAAHVSALLAFRAFPQDESSVRRADAWDDLSDRERAANSAHVRYVYAYWDLRKSEEAAGLPVAPFEKDHWIRSAWPN
jgi:hypothetical protein